MSGYGLESTENAASQSEDEEIEVMVTAGMSGEPLCTIQQRKHNAVASLRRAIIDALDERLLTIGAFDLVNGTTVLSDRGTLREAGLHLVGSTVRLVRRKFRSADMSISAYSERSLGCLRIVDSTSGAQLSLRGAHCGSNQNRHIVSCEMYREPAWVEEEDDGIYAFYHKTVGQYNAADSYTKFVKVKRRLQTRVDMATARDASGAMFVSFWAATAGAGYKQPPAPDAPKTFGANVFSGMRVEVVDSAANDSAGRVRVRIPEREVGAGADGWVRRTDLENIGEKSLEWNGAEIVLEEQVADQEFINLREGTLPWIGSDRLSARPSFAV